MRLLLIEDEAKLAQQIKIHLEREAFAVDLASDGASGLVRAQSNEYDCILLDLGLPGTPDGMVVCKTLREAGNEVPILIVTARGSVEDRVDGLDSGADDYLIKPFNHAELLARVRALMRRPSELQAPVLHAGKTQLDEAKAQVLCSGSPVELRLSERRLLSVLMRRSGSVVAKSVIEEALSEFGRELSANAVEALVSRVRKALGEADSGIVIDTVRGVGYQLRVESDK